MFTFHKDMTLNAKCTTGRAHGRERVNYGSCSFTGDPSNTSGQLSIKISVRAVLEFLSKVRFLQKKISPDFTSA
ncbi:hypothetical protein Y032_0079g1262 [Ancylostoma ceylanicum]|uniref:Uncharacterized protein n=1 Tax=Ancylostoma ceylanicum TaxID=53326 RepID=A0A016TT42_9BILA|nr:hypothetical protein Y032_0079g1262 [Ancylostoma ceylanicum]